MKTAEEIIKYLKTRRLEALERVKKNKNPIGWDAVVLVDDERESELLADIIEDITGAYLNEENENI